MSEKSSFPIFSDLPKGSVLTITGPDGTVLITYTTEVDIPAGSRASIQTS
jgi:hypothetical protein